MDPTLISSLLPFLLISFLIEATPGPNMAYLAVVALSRGRRAGFAAVAGVALGLAVIGAIAALGVAVLIAQSPVLSQALRWAGVLYLLYLAWDTARTPMNGATAENGADGVPSLWVYFWHGVITNLLNPKAAVFYIAVLPGFIIAGDAVMTQTALLTTIYVGVATLVHCLVVLLGSHYHPVMQHPRNEKIARVFFTLALIAVALWFAVSTGA